MKILAISEDVQPVEWQMLSETLVNEAQKLHESNPYNGFQRLFMQF